MKDMFVKPGMRVVPFQKTHGVDLSNSLEVISAHEKGRNFLYVVGWSVTGEPAWSLSSKKSKTSGDWFNSKDFMPLSFLSFVEDFVKGMVGK